MSKFNVTVTPARTRTVVDAPARSACEFFVNTYQRADGAVIPQGGIFRKAENAHKSQEENPLNGPGTRYLGPKSFTLTHP